MDTALTDLLFFTTEKITYGHLLVKSETEKLDKRLLLACFVFICLQENGTKQSRRTFTISIESAY